MIDGSSSRQSLYFAKLNEVELGGEIGPYTVRQKNLTASQLQTLERPTLTKSAPSMASDTSPRDRVRA